MGKLANRVRTRLWLGALVLALTILAGQSCGGQPAVQPPDGQQPPSDQTAPREYPQSVWDALARIPVPGPSPRSASSKQVSVVLPHSFPGGKPYDGNSGWILKGNADTSNPNNAMLSAPSATPPDDLAWIIYQVGDISDTLDHLQLSSTPYNGDLHYGVAAFNHAYGSTGRWEPLFWDSTPDPAITFVVAGADFLSGADNLKLVIFCYNPVQTSITLLEILPVIPPLEPPTDLSATDRTVQGAVHITWDHPASGSTPDGYKIYRSTAQNGTYSQIGTVSYPSTQYDDPLPSDNTVYWYKAISYKSELDDSTYSNADDGAASMRGDWWMFRREPLHNALSPFTGPATNALKWSYTTGGNSVSSSPVIGADGTVFIGSSDWKLYAINPDGSYKWSYQLQNEPLSSPAIGTDGTIYIVDYYSLYAISSNGTLRWNFNGDSNAFDPSPSIGNDGTIYVGAGIGITKLYAINPDNSLKWSLTTQDLSYSSPAIGIDETIYVGCGNGLYAIDLDGIIDWTYTTGNEVNSSPAISDNGTIYVGSDDRKLYAINLDGTLKWSYTIGGIVFTSPAIDSSGAVYVGSYELFAINPNGTLMWSYPISGYSSPAIDAEGTVYIGSSDKSIYAINSNGDLKWTYATGGEVSSSPAIGPDGTVYVGSGDGKLYAIGPGEGNTLNPPTALAASDGAYSDKARVSWTNPGGGPTPDGYKVYRSTTENGTYTQIGTTPHPGTTFDDTTANQATTYWYKAASYKTGLPDSADSNKDSGWRNLPPPTGVTASDGEYSDKVLIYWNAVSGATGYDVYRSDTEGGSYTKLNGSAIDGTSYDDPAEPAGTTYWYKLKTKCALGDSALSTADSGYRATSGSLNPPTNVAASDGLYTGYVYISWTAAAGITPDGYKVYRDTAAGGSYSYLVGQTSNTSISDTTATPGVTYYYKVKSYKAGYADSGWSTYDSGWRKLSAPTGVSASDDTYTDKVRISWTAVSGATSYKIYRSDSSGGSYSLIGTSSTSPYDDTSATAGVTYWYKVKASCTNGDSDFSAYDSGRRATGGGGTWHLVNVAWNGDVGELCSLALVNGGPAIIYNDNNDTSIQYKYSNTSYGDSQSDWSSPVLVDQHNYISPVGPLNVVSGNPAVLNCSTEIHFIRATNPSGSAWGAPVVVYDDVAWYLPIDMNIASGNPATLFTEYDGYKLYFCRANDPQGSTWDQPVNFDTTSFYSPYGVLENTNGYPCVAYFGDGGLKFILALDTAGETWAAPTLLDATAGKFDLLDIAIVAGNPAVIYTCESGCKFKRASDWSGSSWTSLDLGIEPGDYLCLAIIDGKPAVAYKVGASWQDGQLWYKPALNSNGSQWGEPVRIDSTSQDIGYYCSLADINGHPGIAYYDQQNKDLRYAIMY